MELYSACVNCVMGNLLHIAGKSMSSEEEKILFLGEFISRITPEIKTSSCAPRLTGIGCSLLREMTGINDPFKDIKHEFNRLMLTIEEATQEMIDTMDDPLESALVAAGAANLIDFGAFREVCPEKIVKVLHEYIETMRLDMSVYRTFLNMLDRHRSLLIMSDNCGEIVIDKILIRQLKKVFPDIEITCAFREIPVLNDATMDDAVEVGLDKLCNVVSSGSHTPGYINFEAKEGFREFYSKSPLILSKGVGNFEGAEFEDPRNFFLFIVKCDNFSEKLDVPLNTLVFQQGRSSLLKDDNESNPYSENVRRFIAHSCSE